jgi:Imidazolonepropionase and related amidohydrolases
LVQRLYLAKYIVEDVKTIHHDAALIVEDQNVKKIQKKSELSFEQIQNSEDLGDVVISPGLTNAHSHVALNSVKGLGYGTASALYDVMWGVDQRSMKIQYINFLYWDGRCSTLWTRV